MPVQLDLDIANPTLSTHEALRLVCRLQNDDVARTIPSAYDRSGSFRIGLFRDGHSPVRVMDRQTRQAMMSAGRIDSSLDLDTLEANAVWTWDMDLASYDYALAPGRYDLRAVYAYEPEQVHAAWGPQTVHVIDDPLRAVGVVRDNPIIDGLALLFEAGDPARTRWYLRLHNYRRPCGAWWSVPVLEGRTAVLAFSASAGYFQTDSTDPFHRRWIVSLDDQGTVRAQLYDRGDVTSHLHEAPLPADVRFIPSAVSTRDGALLVFAWGNGRLRCYRVEGSRLVVQFEHAPPYPAGTPVSIGADEERIHVAGAFRGLHYETVGHGGDLRTRDQVFRSRLAPYSIRFEAGEQRIKALFFEGGAGRSLQMAVHRLETGETQVRSIDRFPVRDDLRELDFDQDEAGRFHLLASTAGGRLYYESEGRGPVLVAQGEDRFFPIVAASRQVYLGCYRRAYGYRFVHYQRRQHGPKFGGLAQER